MIKEVEYKPTYEKAELLAKDYYKGYVYFVVSYGIHPCGYIALQKGQPYYNAKNYKDVSDLKCHGGCTFVEKGYHQDTINVEDKYTVIGWDYGHYNDFSGIYLQDNFPIPWRDMKIWTTKEIIEECKQVIEQLYVLEHPELSYI